MEASYPNISEKAKINKLLLMLNGEDLRDGCDILCSALMTLCLTYGIEPEEFREIMIDFVKEYEKHFTPKT